MGTTHDLTAAALAAWSCSFVDSQKQRTCHLMGGNYRLLSVQDKQTLQTANKAGGSLHLHAPFPLTALILPDSLNVSQPGSLPSPWECASSGPQQPDPGIKLDSTQHGTVKVPAQRHKQLPLASFGVKA